MINWKDPLIEIKIRIDRGNVLVYWLRNIIISVAGIKYILNLSMMQSVIVGLVSIIVLYLLGWTDLNKLKLAQREAEILTEKYNYYFKKLKKKLSR